MITNEQLAELIFPEITETIEDLERRYPKRNLKEGAQVTRFAPSPTGFLHTGSLFTAMICKKVASQTNGIFYVRLEDTDTKREIEGSGEQLINQLKLFNVTPDEGYFGSHEEGNYGPYVQSQRADIYKVVIKHLLKEGRAYPCFVTSEELNEIRKKQEAQKLNPGYYGEFAIDRFIDNDERARRIKEGRPYVIRFASNGDHTKKIMVHDLIHGDFEIAQNDQDIVIYKSDGLPTYHFAHAVDDHFMRTTTVIRGEEWIASLPIHIELFETLGWEAPRYAHLPVIQKLDENGHKRKLSKRLDKEAAVSYFIEDGYPCEALTTYLMTIANSNFEEWFIQNNYEHPEQFIYSFDKMSVDGALFDITKMQFYAKEYLGKRNKHEMLLLARDYASKYDEKLLHLIDEDPNYFESIMNIDREKENPRKDYYKFGGIEDIIGFFYKEEYQKLYDQGLLFNEKINKDKIIEVLVDLRDNLSLEQDESSWFSQMKDIASKHGFATDRKLFKANPDQYLGMVGDVAEMLRISLTTRKNSPNLYEVMRILGKEENNRRIDLAISQLSK